MTTRLLILLAAALAAAPAAGQTIKSLGYNSTNGNIVAATNVTFTNSVGFATNARAATRTNLGGTTVGNAVFTATNAAAAATAVGLGTSSDVSFATLNATIDAGSGNYSVFNSAILFDDIRSEDIVEKTRTNLGLGGFRKTDGEVFAEIYSGEDLRIVAGDSIEFYEGFSFGGTNAAAFASGSRASLGLGLPALTNTSNVTTMRALAGSTNTNEPYSGTVALTNTNVLTFSNGVLLKTQ